MQENEEPWLLQGDAELMSFQNPEGQFLASVGQQVQLSENPYLWRRRGSRLESVQQPGLYLDVYAPGEGKLVLWPREEDGANQLFDLAPVARIKGLLIFSLHGSDLTPLLNEQDQWEQVLLQLPAALRTLRNVGALNSYANGTKFNLTLPSEYQRVPTILAKAFQRTSSTRFPKSEWRVVGTGMYPHITLGRSRGSAQELEAFEPERTIVFRGEDLANQGHWVVTNTKLRNLNTSYPYPYHVSHSILAKK